VCICPHVAGKGGDSCSFGSTCERTTSCDGIGSDRDGGDGFASCSHLDTYTAGERTDPKLLKQMVLDGRESEQMQVAQEIAEAVCSLSRAACVPSPFNQYCSPGGVHLVAGPWIPICTLELNPQTVLSFRSDIWIVCSDALQSR
jgi:hypothetical protein